MRAVVLQHPPKVKYFPVTITFTITILIARPIHPPKAMSLPDEQELDRKRPMVSPAAVQRSQTVSHKHPEWLDFKP